MRALYEQPDFLLDASERTVQARFRLVNRTDETWRTSDGFVVGWQMFDPETSTFISEGEWSCLNKDLQPAQSDSIEVTIRLPRERGRYHVYISPMRQDSGWFYQRGLPFILLEALVENARARLVDTRVTTLRALRLRNLSGAFGTFFLRPLQTLWSNRSLIQSLAKRDILTRYRGSAGGVLWTVLHPLLLMATYFFVFGVVLQSRFGSDASRTGFALYFLAGMLPWLAFSEAIGRAPSVILEQRLFVKKLVFPVEILPVTQVAAGVVTQLFATALFLVALFVVRGDVPLSVLWLPVLLVPQVLFTLGLSWTLASLGVYFRDLGQIIGFLLTLWFFLTPICYPEASLTPEVAPVLMKNPVYVLVGAYRAAFLESSAPAWQPFTKLMALATAAFFFGHALFFKLRKTFADVI
ncbi:MAG TPA: ABC transporter permease [Bryobacteraceae bacterium]|nr:ABC transporter permease [Bryobacteraceae bacterium]